MDFLILFLYMLARLRSMESAIIASTINMKTYLNQNDTIDHESRPSI